MSSFFRKALSLFVILDEEQPAQAAAAAPPVSPAQPEFQQPSQPEPPLSQTDLSKFEKHFEQLFEKTNLPGPDYYEFWKTMDTLEAHIPEETARMQAVFASLRIQGLTKSILIETAGKYKAAILDDKASFESAVQQKAQAEIAGREDQARKLEAEREQKRQMIAKMQEEIEASAGKIAALQAEIAAEKDKIGNAQRGYLAACTAMVAKIEKDVERFQQIIE